MFHCVILAGARKKTVSKISCIVILDSAKRERVKRESWMVIDTHFDLHPDKHHTHDKKHCRISRYITLCLTQWGADRVLIQ